MTPAAFKAALAHRGITRHHVGRQTITYDVGYSTHVIVATLAFTHSTTTPASYRVNVLEKLLREQRKSRRASVARAVAGAL